jgi:flagellar biosynthesis component FlhA
MLKEHIMRLLNYASIHSEMEVMNNKYAWIKQKRPNGNLLKSANQSHQLAGRKLIKEQVKVKNIATHLKTLKNRQCAWRKCSISIRRITRDVVKKELGNRMKR